MPGNALARTLEKGGGETVETPWGSLNDIVRFRPRSLVNIFSAPSVGKSMLALNLAYGLQEPCLYVSIDTPLETQAFRTWALLNGARISDVEGNPEKWMRRASRTPAGRSLNLVRWAEMPMVVDELGDLVEAEAEYFGGAPRLVVVDVIGDIVKDRSFEGFTHGFSVLKNVARKYRALVVALHHTTKSKEPAEPVWLQDCEYAGDKQPDVVIGLSAPDRRAIRVAVLKSRLGKSDAAGRVYTDLRVDFSRARVSDRSGVERYRESLRG